MRHEAAKLVSEKHTAEGKCGDILKLDDYSTVCGRPEHEATISTHEAKVTTTLVENGKTVITEVVLQWW